MIFVSWSLAHFVSVSVIATAVAAAVLPLVFSSIPAFTIRKIAFLLAVTLSFFILIALFYWIVPAFLPRTVLPFHQPSIHLFMATLIVSQLLIFHAIIHLRENLASSLCASTAIIAGLVLTFVFPLQSQFQERSMFPFFAVIVTSSFFIDLLLFSQIVHRNYTVGHPSSNTFFVALNTTVMLITSAVLSYDIPDTARHIALIIAALIASGFTPFFSYWRYVTLFSIPTSSFYITCFQTLLTVHILSQINFSSFFDGIYHFPLSDYVLFTLLICTLILSLIPNKKKQIQKPVRAISMCMIVAAIAITIYVPAAALHVQTLLFFAIPTFILLFQQKKLPPIPVPYAIYLVILVSVVLFYLPILAYYNFDLLVLPQLSLLAFTQSQVELFFTALLLITLYNIYRLLPFLKAKRATVPQKKSILVDNNKYILILALSSMLLLHALFILIPH